MIIFGAAERRWKLQGSPQGEDRERDLPSISFVAEEDQLTTCLIVWKRLSGLPAERGGLR